jgi:archaeosortase A (PGF-CTERM-specific)
MDSVIRWTLAVHESAAEPLGWVVIAAFLAGWAADSYSRRLARWLTVGAWLLFSVFWLVQLPHFVFAQKSLVEGIGSAIAVPLSAYVGFLLWTGRDSLLILSRSVAVMGVVFMPFQLIEPLQRRLVEGVTYQTEFLMGVRGPSPEVISGSSVCRAATVANGQFTCTETYPDYRNTFLFHPNGERVTYTIVTACTGLGSMAIFAGLVTTVRAPLRRKLRALAVSLPIIYGLNLVRNVFIGLSFGGMRMQVFPELVASVFGFSLARDPAFVSYYLADRIIAQTASVIALVAITYLVVRELPEVLTIVEDLLFVMTGAEYDLRSALFAPVGSAD